LKNSGSPGYSAGSNNLKKSGASSDFAGDDN